MDLLLIRHGEPDPETDPVDPPLTALGHAQAAATAAYLADTHLDAVYVSPQLRAQQTCAPLIAERGIESVTDERIAEFDYEIGTYVQPALVEAKTREEAMAALKRLQGPDFHARVRAGINDAVAANKGNRIAIVCHGGVINSYIMDVLGSTEPLSPYHASLTRVAVSSKANVRSMLTFNEHDWIPTSL